MFGTNIDCGLGTGEPLLGPRNTQTQRRLSRRAAVCKEILRDIETLRKILRGVSPTVDAGTGLETSPFHSRPLGEWTYRKAIDLNDTGLEKIGSTKLRKAAADELKPLTRVRVHGAEGRIVRVHKDGACLVEYSPGDEAIHQPRALEVIAGESEGNPLVSSPLPIGQAGSILGTKVKDISSMSKALADIDMADTGL